MDVFLRGSVGMEKGNGHFSGFRGGWTVLNDLPVLGVFGVAESKKRKKFWIPPPQGADLGGGRGKNSPYYLKLIWHVVCQMQ